MKEKGCSLLLYKDARVDQKILDETVGPYNWERLHARDNANCIVSLWDKEKQQWIRKEDTGAESYSDKEKGLASDSFKRACFNWGIGRELYTAPFIWIKLQPSEVYNKNNKYYLKSEVQFSVGKIKTVDGKIEELTIVDQKNRVRYSYPYNNSDNNDFEGTEPTEQPKPKRNISKEKEQEVKHLFKGSGMSVKEFKNVLKNEGVNEVKMLTEEQANNIMLGLIAYNEKKSGMIDFDSIPDAKR